MVIHNTSDTSTTMATVVQQIVWYKTNKNIILYEFIVSFLTFLPGIILRNTVTVNYYQCKNILKI